MLQRNVLIFHLGALGDFIVTWPLALTLARLFPQSRIFYVTHGQKGALAEKVLRIESMDIEAGWHQLFAQDAELPAAAAKALAGAHTVVSFLPDEGGRWKQNIGRANPQAKLISLSTSPEPQFAGHICDFLIDQLHDWSAGQTAAKLLLKSVNDRGVPSTRDPAGPILVHPGSGAPRKNWAPEKFLDLIQKLLHSGRKVQCVLGEVELEQWGSDRVGKFERVADVVRPQTLLELLGHLRRASAFIGNDSGPSHLAGILGLPAVCVFGETSNPTRWKPLGPRLRVLCEPLEHLQADEVLNAVETMLATNA